jgi:ABC-type multidrug transport system fused ATPase/permease subunit
MNHLQPDFINKFRQLIENLLNDKIHLSDGDFENKFHDSQYMKMAKLKYQRRLVDMHVVWLNSIFLILGVAAIVIYFVYLNSAERVDWGHLLFFLIALKYAIDSLQQVSSASVAFSRFMPEISPVYQLLDINENGDIPVKEIKERNSVIYIDSRYFEEFEQKYFFQSLKFSGEFVSIDEIKKQGIQNWFKKNINTNSPVVIYENRLEKLKTFLNSNREKMLDGLFSYYSYTFDNIGIQPIKLDELLNYKRQKSFDDMIDDLEDIG